MDKASRVPESIEDLVHLWDPTITKQIKNRCGRACSAEDRLDLKQDVYHRIVAKHFLERCRELFALDPSRDFARSLSCLTRSVCCNYLEYLQSRPLHHAIHNPPALEMTDTVFDLLASERELALQDFSRQLVAQDSLEKFNLFLQGKRGKYARSQVDLAEVFRLWCLYGESRQTTHQIAVHLHITEAWARELKRRVIHLSRVYFKTPSTQ